MSLTSILLVSSIFVIGCHGYRLNLQLPANKYDCVYLPRVSGEKMNLVLQVLEGAQKVQLTMHSPRKDIIVRQDIVMINIDEMIHITGDYALCFYNKYSRDTAVVGVEYDMHMKSQEGILKKQLRQEKKQLVEKIIDQMKPSIINTPSTIQAHEKDEFFQKSDQLKKARENKNVDNSTAQLLKEKLLMISMNMDQVEQHMNIHKSTLTHHHYLQKANNAYVDKFSTLLCVAMVVAGCTQVVLLKSFFNGQLSWKVWQF